MGSRCVKKKFNSRFSQGIQIESLRTLEARQKL